MKVEQIIRKAFDEWKMQHPEQQESMEAAIAKALRDASLLKEDESRLNIAHPFKGKSMTPCTQCGLGYLHDIHKEQRNDR